jgi:hypothetical protein
VIISGRYHDSGLQPVVTFFRNTILALYDHFKTTFSLETRSSHICHVFVVSVLTRVSTDSQMMMIDAKRPDLETMMQSVYYGLLRVECKFWVLGFHV